MSKPATTPLKDFTPTDHIKSTKASLEPCDYTVKIHRHTQAEETPIVDATLLFKGAVLCTLSCRGYGSGLNHSQLLEAQEKALKAAAVAAGHSDVEWFLTDLVEGQHNKDKWSKQIKAGKHLYLFKSGLLLTGRAAVPDSALEKYVKKEGDWLHLNALPYFKAFAPLFIVQPAPLVTYTTEKKAEVMDLILKYKITFGPGKKAGMLWKLHSEVLGFNGDSANPDLLAAIQNFVTGVLKKVPEKAL